MNKYLWAVLAVAALFVAADGLNCYSCSVGILGRCVFSNTQTCTGNITNCYSGTAAFNISGALNFYTSGCINTCSNSTGSILGAGYTITQTCCSTNLCNGASSIQLPITAAIAAALLATTWSFM